MSNFPSLNPLSTIRQSKVITNHQTIANQTQIVTPSNTKFKRTVLHTPAIIETIVDTPEVPLVSAPVVRHAPPVEYVSRVPVGRVESTVTRGVPIGFSGSGVRPREEVRRGTVVRGGDWEREREIGVKVNEDLSGFRPSVGVRHEEGKRAGGCGGILGYCWGNRCPFWVFILVPVLLVLAVLGVSSFVKKHRVFYGYDTSTMGRMGEMGARVGREGGGAVVQPIVSTDQAGTGTGVGIDHNVNTGLNTGMNTNLNTNLNPAVDPNLDPNTNSLTPNLNLHPTTTTDLPSATTATTTTRSLTGNDIYSQVLARQQNSLPSPQTSSQTTSTTTSSNDQLINQTPGVLQNTTTETTQTANLAGIRLAPTIEELKTRLMIEAERAAGKSHQRRSHLRFYVG